MQFQPLLISLVAFCKFIRHLTARASLPEACQACSKTAFSTWATRLSWLLYILWLQQKFHAIRFDVQTIYSPCNSWHYPDKCRFYNAAMIRLYHRICYCVWAARVTAALKLRDQPSLQCIGWIETDCDDQNSSEWAYLATYLLLVLLGIASLLHSETQCQVFCWCSGFTTWTKVISYGTTSAQDLQ